jgi:hypothetical protein
MNDTLPTTPADAEHCQLDWCTNRRGHTDNHLRVIGVVEPTAWSEYQAVIVTVEAGRGETDPLPVLTLVGKDARHAVRMEWREAEALADLLARAVEDHDPDVVVQPRMRGNVAPADLSTEYGHDDWQRALVRIGASGTIEMTGTAVVVEHDATDDTLRLHAPERTEVDRVREVVRAAAIALGLMPS